MNNIEILEKLVKRCKECKFACCEQCEINNTQVRVIENLIQENKELKEKQCVYKDTSSCNKTLSFETYIKLNEYIPKSKLKEIIDKVDGEDYYCLNEAEEDLRKLEE